MHFTVEYIWPSKLCQDLAVSSSQDKPSFLRWGSPKRELISIPKQVLICFRQRSDSSLLIRMSKQVNMDSLVLKISSRLLVSLS